MDLTPLDVRKKKDDFKRTMRGYDPRQVEGFLAVAADSLERYVRESVVLGERVEQQERELETYRARERALNDALLAAQELREEARLQSERDAAVRVREAEARVQAVIGDAEEAVRLCQQKIEDLTVTRGKFLGSLRKLFERFDEYLEFESARFGDGPGDLRPLMDRLRRVGREEAAGAAGVSTPEQSPIAPASITPVDAGGPGAAST
ncbi:DivIVA domain-containing protein [Candidatus Palauibacter sp.]|uniref:DivIVA domain-containing protein n=1 Tax=Candidatus Palauibacter sp. TaxID=3101350 RepID=UPI003AF309E3